MKKRSIKYEKLSSSIKKEIEQYYNQEKERKNFTMEEAMFHWFEEKFDRWLIDTYAKDKAGNKRKHHRLDIEIPVRIVETLIESASDDSEAFDFLGTILNISRGGLYFRSGKPIEKSSIIKVNVDLSAVDKDLENIEALAMVVRLDKLEAGSYGVGVMFSSIYDEHQECLDFFIFKNVAYHIYSS